MRWHGPLSIVLGLVLGYWWYGFPNGIFVGLWAGAIHLFLDSLGGRQLWRNLVGFMVVVSIYLAIHRVPCL